jgi:hypothetical protein
MPRGLRNSLLYRTLFGYDIFISYSRRDSLDYAYAIARHFMAKGYECYIDQLSSIQPGKALPSNIKKAVARATAFILIGSEGAKSSEPIDNEIEHFRDHNRNRPLIPVDINHSIDQSARWFGRIEGLPLIADRQENLVKGKPSPEVLDRIESALKFTRKSEKLRKIVLATIAFIVLILAAGAYYSYIFKRTADRNLAMATAAQSNLKESQLTLNRNKDSLQQTTVRLASVGDSLHMDSVKILTIDQSLQSEIVNERKKASEAAFNYFISQANNASASGDFGSALGFVVAAKKIEGYAGKAFDNLLNGARIATERNDFNAAISFLRMARGERPKDSIWTNAYSAFLLKEAGFYKYRNAGEFYRILKQRSLITGQDNALTQELVDRPPAFGVSAAALAYEREGHGFTLAKDFIFRKKINKVEKDSVFIVYDLRGNEIRRHNYRLGHRQLEDLNNELSPDDSSIFSYSWLDATKYDIYDSLSHLIMTDDSLHSYSGVNLYSAAPAKNLAVLAFGQVLTFWDKQVRCFRVKDVEYVPHGIQFMAGDSLVFIRFKEAPPKIYDYKNDILLSRFDISDAPELDVRRHQDQSEIDTVSILNKAGNRLHSFLLNCPICQIELTPDNQYICAFENDPWMVYNIKGQHIRDIDASDSREIAFLPNTKKFVAMPNPSYYEKNYAVLYDYGKDSLLELNTVYPLKSINFSSDSTRIITTAKNKERYSVRIWDTAGRLISVPIDLPVPSIAEENLQHPPSARLTPDGNGIIVHVADSVLNLYNLKGQLISNFSVDGEITNPYWFTEDGKRLFVNVNRRQVDRSGRADYSYIGYLFPVDMNFILKEFDYPISAARRKELGLDLEIPEN